MDSEPEEHTNVHDPEIEQDVSSQKSNGDTDDETSEEQQQQHHPNDEVVAATGLDDQSDERSDELREEDNSVTVESPPVVEDPLQQDEGIEDGDPDVRDESRRDDTYSSSRSDSLVETVESFISVDINPPPPAIITLQGSKAPPIHKSPNTAQRSSKSPASTAGSSRTSLGSKKGKRKSNDVSVCDIMTH